MIKKINDIIEKQKEEKQDIKIVYTNFKCTYIYYFQNVDNMTINSLVKYEVIF